MSPQHPHRVERTAQAELDALTSLIESEGWQILTEHHEQCWGPVAFEAQVDQHPDEVRRIRDTFKGVRAEHHWVQDRIAALQKAVSRTALVDAFRDLRRGPQSA